MNLQFANPPKWLLKKTFLLLCMLYISGNLISQENESVIKGRVTTKEGKILPYASVTLSGTKTGTLTDEQGNFTLKVSGGDYTLVISYAGYKPTTIPVNIKSGQQDNLGNIKLEISDNILEEVSVEAMINKFSKKESEHVARMPLKNLENPQVYTVVPKELLEEQVSVDFKSALMSSPGVANVTLGLGSGGTGLSMHLRGFSGANGAGAIRNGMATNWVSLSDPANLESLEIIKGPSATLFGSTLISYGGLLNRVTKKANKDKGGQVSFSTGSFGLGRITADYNTPLNDDKTMLFRINAAVQREKSFQDYGQNKTLMLAPTFTYLVSDKLTLDLDLEYFESHRNTTYVRVSSTTPIDNLDDLNWDFNKSYTSNQLLSSAKVLNSFVQATYKISENWESQTALSYSNTDNNANYLFLLVNDADSLTRRVMNIPSMFSTVQVQQNFLGKFNIGIIKNKLLVGLDYTQLQTTDTRKLVNYDKVAINQSNTYLNAGDVMQTLAATDAYYIYKRDRKTYSAYISDVANITDMFVLMLGVRLDNYHDFTDDYTQTALSPKIGLIYKLIDDKVSIFGNYMNGFQNVSPNYTEENPDELVRFDPEHANQIEGGIKFELMKGKLNGTVSYYNISVENKVRNLTGSDGSSYAVQDATQKNEGLEVDLIANPIKGMHIVFGYGYNDSEYTKADEGIMGNRPYSVPVHVGNFWFSHRSTSGRLNGFGFGVGANFSSDNFLNDQNTITVPGHLTFDGTLFYDIPAFRIGLKMNNLTDEEYWMSDYDAEPQMPRSFVCNLTLRF